jgi:hypothetical protein
MRVIDEAKQRRDSTFQNDSCKRQRISSPLLESRSDDYFEVVLVPRERIHVRVATLIAHLRSVV